jgi:hypothetical protein
MPVIPCNGAAARKSRPLITPVGQLSRLEHTGDAAPLSKSEIQLGQTKSCSIYARQHQCRLETLADSNFNDFPTCDETLDLADIYLFDGIIPQSWAQQGVCWLGQRYLFASHVRERLNSMQPNSLLSLMGPDAGLGSKRLVSPSQLCKCLRLATSLGMETSSQI